MLKWKLTRRVVMGICLLGAPWGVTVQAQEAAQAQDAAPATPPPVAVPDTAPDAAKPAPMSPTDKPAAPAAVEGGELYLIGPDGQKRKLRSMQTGPNDEYRKALHALPQGERYMIGVALWPIPPEVRSRLKIDSSVGLILGNVLKGKPAAEAGLQTGDILYQVNGKGVSQLADVVRLVNETKGQPVMLSVVRETETLEQKLIEVQVTPVEFSKELAALVGLEPVELSPEMMQKLRELGVTPGTQVVGPGVIVNSTSLLSREVIDLKLKVGRLEQDVGQLQHQVDELKQILKSALTPPGEAPVN